MPIFDNSGAAAPAGIFRRNGVYIASFLMDCGLSFGTVGSSYRAKAEFNADPADLGLLTLVTAGSYVIFCLVFGRLSDRWGRRRLIFLGATLDALALALTAGASSFWQICAGMGLFSAGQGAFWPSMEADISDHSTTLELPRRLGRFNVSWCLGFLVGWPAAGVIGQLLGGKIRDLAGQPANVLADQAAGQKLVLLIGAALALASLAVYLTRTFAPEDVGSGVTDKASAGRARARAVPFWYIALVLNFAAMGLSGVLRSQMAEVTGADKSAQGGMFGAFFFGAQVAVFAALALWRGWHYRAAPLMVGTILAILGALLCGFSKAPAIFSAGCLLGGLGCGVAYYSSIYYSVAAASARGHRGGIHEAVLGAGGAVVPYAGGLLAVAPWVVREMKWPAGVSFLLAGAVLAAALAAVMLVYLRLRREPPAASSEGP